MGAFSASSYLVVFCSCLGVVCGEINLGSIVPLLQVSFGLHTAARLILHAENKIMRAGGHHLPSASGSKWVSWSLHVDYGGKVSVNVTSFQ